ncbi:MAG: MBL fold metallo-hydrolase [Promethearchaeota archaeon]|nr:MAG: MBL fold metallo-hydrolase [Candidatus Lokiarchaeota archaeon]
MIKTEIMVLSNNIVIPFQQLQKTYGLNFIEFNKLFATQSLAEHGLGFLINIYDVKDPDDQWAAKLKKKIIFDTGGLNKTYIHNLDIRNYNLYDVDNIILSHWHYDHTGGLNEILNRIDKDITIICHPDAKYERFFRRSKEIKNSDLKDKTREDIVPLLSTSKIVNQEPVNSKRIKDLGGNMVFSKNPYELYKDADLKITVTGEIARKYKEEDFNNFFSLQEGTLKVDKILDDKCLIFEYNENIVLLTGCCHSGIMNTVDYVKNMTDTDKPITHIIGGMHMASASKERFSSTIKFFKTLKSEKLNLFPIHCSGERFIQEINTARIRNTKAFNCSVGTVFDFRT